MHRENRTGGRRAGGGLAERLAQIKKRDPQGWAKNAARSNFYRWLDALFDARAFVTPLQLARSEAETEAVLVAAGADNRIAAMVPWLWRELSADPYGERLPEIVRSQTRQEFAHRIRDWARATRPNLLNYTMASANDAAIEWHEQLEAKDNATALRKLVQPNYTDVLKTPYGTWRQFDGDLRGFMAVGKMLGHCYQHEYNARSYGERQTTYNLFGKDGRPVGALTVDGREVTETKGVQNEHVLPASDLGKADVLLIKHLFPEDWHTNLAVWGEGARHLLPLDELNAAKDKPKGQTNQRPCKGRRDTRPQPLLLGRSAKPCNTPPGWNHVGKDCARYVRSDIRGNIHDVTRKHAADCWCYRCVRANEVQARDHDGPFRSATTAMNYAHRREQHLIKSPVVEGHLNRKSRAPRPGPRGRRMPLTNPQWVPKYVLCVEVWTLQDGKTTGTRVARLETFADADEGQTAARQAAQGLNPQFAIKVSHLSPTGASHAVRVVLRELDTDKLVPQGLLEPLAFAPDKMPMLLGAQSIAEAFGRMEGVNLKKPLRSRQ